ncbi:MAG: hypothetical protein ACFE0Q_06045 [Anaerolineae bacterium]
MRYLVGILISTCLLLLHYSEPHAQQTLDLNTMLEGTVSRGETVRYNFNAREGQLLSFVASAEDSLDPILHIESVSNTLIMRNDDYDYPNTLDAIIEGFTAPYSGNYTLVVSGYGDSSGTYQVGMFSGYSQLFAQDVFNNGGNWQAVGLMDGVEPRFEVVNGTANLALDGINESGLALGLDAPEGVYFLRGMIDSITDTAGWRVGLVFGYQNELNFYRVLVNYRGAWRLTVMQNGEERVLRDWNVHPAILPDTRTFSLSVLINDGYFDVFYNDQYVGSGADSTWRSGQIGITTESIDTIGSTVTARFDEVSITQPTALTDGTIFPLMIMNQGTNSSIRELEQRLLIPAGGEMAFTLTESFAQNNRAGVSRFQIGSGRTATNFALSARVSWANSGSALNGCGLTVRDTGDDRYVLAYIDSEGGAGLSERDGEQFTQNMYREGLDTLQAPYDMVLIVRDDLIHYYLNGQHIATLGVPARDGVISSAVVNFEDINTNCQFNNLWMWQWD